MGATAQSWNVGTQSQNNSHDQHRGLRTEEKAKTERARWAAMLVPSILGIHRLGKKWLLSPRTLDRPLPSSELHFPLYATLDQ